MTSLADEIVAHLRTLVGADAMLAAYNQASLAIEGCGNQHDKPISPVHLVTGMLFPPFLINSYSHAFPVGARGGAAAARRAQAQGGAAGAPCSNSFCAHPARVVVV